MYCCAGVRSLVHHWHYIPNSATDLIALLPLSMFVAISTSTSQLPTFGPLYSATRTRTSKSHLPHHAAHTTAREMGHKKSKKVKVRRVVKSVLRPLAGGCTGSTIHPDFSPEFSRRPNYLATDQASWISTPSPLPSPTKQWNKPLSTPIASPRPSDVGKSKLVNSASAADCMASPSVPDMAIDSSLASTITSRRKTLIHLVVPPPSEYETSSPTQLPSLSYIPPRPPQNNISGSIVCVSTTPAPSVCSGPDAGANEIFEVLGAALVRVHSLPTLSVMSGESTIHSDARESTSLDLDVAIRRSYSYDLKLKTKAHSCVKHALRSRLLAIPAGVKTALKSAATSPTPRWERWRDKEKDLKGSDGTQRKFGILMKRKMEVTPSGSLDQAETDGKFPYCGNWKAGARYRYLAAIKSEGPGFVLVGAGLDEPEPALKEDTH
ncbi:hypothetical protein BDZ91DRAFT_738921 [Kalaharituber pfeilii]|nr:hypothetical protein BDZ91DRAFT_738921 [Kalaharituber pfeilii]